jgi:beta-mannosidase
MPVRIPLVTHVVGVVLFAGEKHMGNRLFGAALSVLLIITAGQRILHAETAKETPLWKPFYVDPRPGDQHLSLDGAWNLGYRDVPIASIADLQGLKWIEADVPVSAQWALYEAGNLPYPYAHLNTRQYTWVPQKVWYYKRTFNVPPAAREDFDFLCFDGAGYYTRIWLNGTLIGRHEGMFGGPHVEVSRRLKFDGPNEIVVEVKAGSYGEKTWDPDHYGNGKVAIPWGLAGGSEYVTKSSGIDPKEIEPLGIWQPVRLEMAPKVHLGRPFLITEKATEAQAALQLRVEVLADTTALDTVLADEYGTIRDTSKPQEAEEDLALRMELVDKSTSRTALQRDWPLKIVRGRNWITKQFDFSHPRLWWPNGLGDPNLYRVHLSLLRDGKEIDRLEFDYGIRTIERVATPGPQTQDRWEKWQFVVNGRPFFMKGMNWAWPLDVLLHLPADKYRWLLEEARAAHIQMLRVWGGGNTETDDFYRLCDELGIMVWEDFPLANSDSPGLPQSVWEAQVMQTVFRLRNHPSLAVWCGGSEFNPSDPGNTTNVGIIERSVRDFDGTRMFVRTTPDAGDAHIYADQDPTWYGHRYRDVPFISETGIYNMPDPESLLRVVDSGELQGAFQDIFTKNYAAQHPEFVHHMLEYQGSEPRTLVSRASQMDDLATANLQRFSSDSQMAAAEFTQVYADLVQANYPVISGLMPWSFTIPWPIQFFMFVDGFGQPTASYYTIKRLYEPTHVLVKLPEMLWAKGENVPISISIAHSLPEGLSGASVSVQVLDDHFHPLWTRTRSMDVPAGPSAASIEMGDFTIPDRLEDKFFFIVAEAKDAKGALISRSVYWPRCLKLMSDPAFRAKYRGTPQPSLKFEHGPWLRPQVEEARTRLELKTIARTDISETESRLRILVRNAGSSPAFDTHVNIAGTERVFYATDNDFWLAPGEDRTIEMRVEWSDPGTRNSASVTGEAWNAAMIEVSLPASK